MRRKVGCKAVCIDEWQIILRQVAARDAGFVLRCEAFNKLDAQAFGNAFFSANAGGDVEDVGHWNVLC